MSRVSDISRVDGIGKTQLMASSIKFEMKDDPFVIPLKFKRELPINRNIFELKES
jgi:hypothetical protein